MSTLELIWDAQTSYKLWSWTAGTAHHVAHVIRRLPHHPHLCTVRIGERGAAAPRSNTDVRAGLALVKLAHTAQGADALAREAAWYARLQGDDEGAAVLAVPRCLGLFRSKRAGAEVACLVLEYCTGEPGDPMRDPHREIMAAAYAVHAAGVLHGDLLDGRHFVRRGRQMALVDFAAAVPHRCTHGARVRGPDGRVQVGVCKELAALERVYGVHRG
ncbi:hypothetical protein B0H15DRAFT_784633 [Mycena belliarum]|uniref:Protein kinase domain-containing protein n=1 Tax=Mycena belliarum TaxID=1033014 RepID=A0AAD6U0A4_9AGAR|nr:hypothetical protein B0H15DRAFT_784633 [Mycena belliae]